MKINSLKDPIVVWAGDIHCNSTVALSAPTAELPDGMAAGQSQDQEKLWLAWRDGWKKIKRLKRNVVVVLGGEICDIDSKDRSDQYITRNPGLAQSNAMLMLEPVFEVANKFIVLRGTEAHSGKSAWTDEGIARQIHKDIKIEVVKNGSQYSWYEHDFFIGGRKFNLAHHVSMGTSKRTERDAANHLSADLIMSYARSRDPLPHYALRGHVHRNSDSSINYPIHSIIAPCWSLQNSYIHRIGSGNALPEIGLVIVDPIQDKVEWYNYHLKRREPRFV